MAKMLTVDPERCLGCHSCVLACAMAHTDAATLAEALDAETPPQARVHVEPAGEYALPMQCRHCEDAPCLAVCPTGAIYRNSEESIPVLIKPDKCIGCRLCMLVCPFGVIDLSRNGKAMIKCDLCLERTAAGQLPACVEACPTKALQYRQLDEQLARCRRAAALQLAESTEEPSDGSDQG
jgi:carbon-monoxide dehydrogenase iron sulfur subunit